MKGTHLYRVFHSAILLVSMGVFAYFGYVQGNLCPAHAKAATCMLRLDLGSFAFNLISGGNYVRYSSQVEEVQDDAQLPDDGEGLCPVNTGKETGKSLCSPAKAPAASDSMAGNLPGATSELKNTEPHVPIYVVLHAWRFHVS